MKQSEQDKKIERIEKHVIVMNTELGETRDEIKLLNKEFSGMKTQINKDLGSMKLQISEELGTTKIQITKIATNLEWLTKIIFPLIMLILTGFVGAMVKLILK